MERVKEEWSEVLNKGRGLGRKGMKGDGDLSALRSEKEMSRCSRKNDIN